MGPADLALVLSTLPRAQHPDLLVGFETSDDAGVFRLREDLAIINTVDFFTPVVDDPYTYGQISAANSLSDVYAMGGEPKTAMNIVCFPQNGLDKAILRDILQGGADKAAEAGVVVVGGHSVADDEIKYGMAVTGIIDPRHIRRNVGVRLDDVLILTKPLGTGILTTALKRGHLAEEEYKAAVASMAMLNATAAEVMQRHTVHACTDITGFSLMGHSCEMAAGSGVTLRIRASALPILPGALRLAMEGYITGGCKRNRTYLADKVLARPEVPQDLNEVAFDPQTSGGLLIAAPESEAQTLTRELLDAGVLVAAIIGEATPRQEVWVELV
ncbi:MAG TPA: selenide, water dikinase SelD [Methylomirabilota bacterium]|nr:selenide, water dikinase SelD [Methylomirabilota bacterium]